MEEHHKIQDEWLVLQYQGGNQRALTILVNKWHNKLLYHAYKLLNDKEVAQDVVQDSWTAIIFKIGSLKDPQQFRYWAHRIVHNKCVDWIRKKQRERKQEEALKEEIYDQNEVVDARENELQLMVKALANLPHTQRTILSLFYLRQHSVKEIALILKIPVGTVKSRLFKARELLKELIKINNHEKE